MAPVITPIAAMKNKTWLIEPKRPSLVLVPQRRALERLGEQHLLREDQVGAVVVGELVVMAHRDRVERARDLAVAAEDAAREVDLVDLRVALARRYAMLGRVLGGDDADAVRRARGRAERAADALLQARVLEAVQLVAAAGARGDGRLLLRILDRDRRFAEAPERRHQPARRLAERAPDAARGARRRCPLNHDHVLARAPGRHVQARRICRRLGHQCVTTTSTAVTSALSVASGSRVFQPKRISWS